MPQKERVEAVFGSTYDLWDSHSCCLPCEDAHRVAHFCVWCVCVVYRTIVASASCRQQAHRCHEWNKIEHSFEPSGDAYFKAMSSGKSTISYLS